jgi:hypothetical protein
VRPKPGRIFVASKKGEQQNGFPFFTLCPKHYDGLCTLLGSDREAPPCLTIARKAYVENCYTLARPLWHFRVRTTSSPLDTRSKTFVTNG